MDFVEVAAAVLREALLSRSEPPRGSEQSSAGCLQSGLIPLLATRLQVFDRLADGNWASDAVQTSASAPEILKARPP